MAHKPVLNGARVISLIPNSGIQYLDFGFSSDDAGLPSQWDCLDANRNGRWGDVGEFALLARDEVALDPSAAKRGASYTLDRAEALSLAEGRWLPLPLFRRAGESVRYGPTNWARVRLAPLEIPDSDGNDYRVVVAIDTGLMDFVDDAHYLGPSQEDARVGLPFAVAAPGASLAWFTGQEWVRLWLLDAFEARLRESMPGATETLDDAGLRDEAQGPAEPLLRYAALVDLLGEILPPAFRLEDTVSGRRLEMTDVDLVLDVGNSRTCGLLIERDPEHGADVSQAVKLEIRNLSAPEHVYDDPFESRVEFAQVDFGRTDLSHRSGRSDCFNWPAMVRVGFEAAALAGARVGNEGNSGMSSPKRYLWSTDQTVQAWRYNSGARGSASEPYAAQGTFAVLINDAGAPLHLMDDSDDDKLPAMEARYSRSSLFAFALTEVLLHALGMINSPAHRLRRPNSDSPRRLRRVIMTMPSAIPIAEREILRRRAHEALDLAYLGLGLATEATGMPGIDWSRAQVNEPEVVLQWDEASATQVVYLYTRVVKHFFGHARACMDALRRPGAAHSHGLRVATLDIGGGTTDLVVTDFDCEGQGNSVTLFPEQRFREGFNVAGDDIVFRVIQRHVLEPIERAAEASGVTAPAALTAALFGGDRGGMDVSTRVRRQQFAVQVAAPIAVGLLSRYEQSFEDDTAPEPVPFDDFFAHGVRPAQGTLDYVNDEVARRGGSGFSVELLRFPVEPTAIDATVRSVLRTVLDVLSEVIWYYGADQLLVSGRPSRFPAVRALLTESLPMLGGRIQMLHGFRAGQWYPFRDAEGRIEDPKTTAAVGAMLCAMAEGGVEHFNFRSDRIRVPSSTARFIGKLDTEGRLLDEDVYYADLDLDDADRELDEQSFEFRGVMSLGFRQFPNDWWPATRLYTLGYESEDSQRELHARTPIHVQLKRQKRSSGDALSENLQIASAMDTPQGQRASRNVGKRLKLQLQTLSDGNGYWIDTGVLRPSS